MKTRLLITLITLTTIFAEKLYLTEFSSYRLNYLWVELEGHTSYFYDSLGNEKYWIITDIDEDLVAGERKDKAIPHLTAADTIHTTEYQIWDYDTEQWNNSLLSTIVTTKKGVTTEYRNSCPDSSGGWRLYEHGITLFSEKGTPLVDSSYSISSNGTISYAVDSFYYDHVGLCTLSVRFSESSGIRKNISDIRYTYNTEGKVVDEIRRNWDEDHWNYVFRVQTSYAGDSAIETFSRYNDNTWKLGDRLYTVRNAKGQITDKIKMVLEYEKWSLNDHEIYTYNDAGKIETYLFNKGFSNGNRPEYRIRYEYLQDTLMSKETKEFFNKSEETKGKWEPKKESRYTYKTLDQITAVLDSETTNTIIPVQTSHTGITISSPAKELQIYSLQGRLLRSIAGVFNGTSTHFTAPKDLGKAPYILKILNSNNMEITPAFLHHF